MPFPLPPAAQAAGRRRAPLLLGASAAVLTMSVAACSATSSTAASPGGAAASAAGTVAAGTAQAGGESGVDAGSVNVCSLLTATAARTVATRFKLSADPSATYKLTTEKQPPPTTSYPTSACRFTIFQVTADNTGSEAIVTVTVQPAKYLDRTGTKLSGLGDEAYDEGEYVEVRVGSLVLQSNENSGAGKDFINALYRAMIPRLRNAESSPSRTSVPAASTPTTSASATTQANPPGTAVGADSVTPKQLCALVPVAEADAAMRTSPPVTIQQPDSFVGGQPECGFASDDQSVIVNVTIFNPSKTKVDLTHAAVSDATLKPVSGLGKAAAYGPPELDVLFGDRALVVESFGGANVSGPQLEALARLFLARLS